MGLQSSAGLLSARPIQPQAPAPRGLQPLELESNRDGWLYVPEQYHRDHPAPLVLTLHGAGGQAQAGLDLLQPLADHFGILLLAIDSRDRRTWDVIINRYGPDIRFIDQALGHTFSRYAIDPEHLAIAGFSDGASYALSVGITNGNLFSHVIAFSPGFMAPAGQQGEPYIFISHGTADPVLNINRCSRKIAPKLQQAGYQVDYREFEGGHTVPHAIAIASLHWFLPHSALAGEQPTFNP
uniref:Phospholipase/Carboxylesterase n=1 Tax=Cyanothece sp. (strain PCC 7425 / ATCC 29141) TaxID=395961 RepID=B8HKS8_CYAP4